MHGKPMIEWTIDAAFAALNVDKVCVSTNDRDIVRYCHKYMSRPENKDRMIRIDIPDSAVVTDRTQLEYPQLYDVFLHMPPPIPSLAVVLQPTSPLRTAAQIEQAIDLFRIQRKLTPSDKSVAVVGVHRAKALTWAYNGTGCTAEYNIDNRPRSQDVGFVSFKRLVENGSFYLFESDMWTRFVTGTSRLYADKVFPYIVDEWTALEVDTEDDFRYIEGVLSKKNASSMAYKLRQ